MPAARAGGALLCLAGALLLGSCANFEGLAPKARPTDPAGLAANRTLANTALSPADWPAADWWRRFGDPQLDALVAEALAGNPGMRGARARVDKAAARAAASGAALGPQASAEADITRQRLSGNGIFPPPLAGSSYTQTQLAASISYEIDLWGRNRAAYQAALGEVRAAEVDAYAARLLLASAVVRAYVQFAHSLEQLDLAQAALAQREALLELVRQRVAAGLDSDVELKHAEAAIPPVQLRIAQLEAEIGLGRNLLAALLGQGPDRGLAIARPQLHLATPGLPSMLPSDLLGRRPDVLAQRWRVEAARSEIEAAKGEFYPNVNLSALVGLQTVTLSRLLRADSAVPALGPALHLPLFDGGRLRANLAAKDADYDLAVEQYNQTLVEALREVVDQLTALRSIGAQRVQIERALKTSEEAYRLAQERYGAGIGSNLQVLAAEEPLLEQRSFHADLRAQELELSVSLIRALGGGFEVARAEGARTAMSQ